MTLANIWFFLVAVLLPVYVILDGFDLGAGVLYPFITRNDAEKALIRGSIGPVWDGNEVWLLTGAGAIFAAFPMVYAMTFSGFYLAIMLVLFGLIYLVLFIAWLRIFVGIIRQGPEDPAEMLEAARGIAPAPAGAGR